VSQRVIRLFGFEEGLVDRISERFRFADPGYQDLGMIPGRHLFVGALADVHDLSKELEGYNKDHEPVIALGSNVGPGVPPTSSSSSKQEWNIQAVIRFGKAPEVVKALLEDLSDFLLLQRGRISTGFQIKGSVMVARPTIIDVDKEDQVLASTVIRFFAVPLPI